MLTGLYAARNIAGAQHDVWAVNTDKEYHEEGRVAELNAGDRLFPAPVGVSVPEDIEAQQDEVIEAAFARLDPFALGAAIGCVTAVGLMLSTAVLLVRGGEHVGRTLSLLNNYIPGFEVTWTGAMVGGVEAGVMGFGLGYFGARLRNGAIQLYALFVRWRGDSDARRHLLDRV